MERSVQERPVEAPVRTTRLSQYWHPIAASTELTDQPQRAVGVAGLADDLHARLLAEQQAQPAADEPVVVGDDDPHGTGCEVRRHGRSA